MMMVMRRCLLVVVLWFSFDNNIVWATTSDPSNCNAVCMDRAALEVSSVKVDTEELRRELAEQRSNLQQIQSVLEMCHTQLRHVQKQQQDLTEEQQQQQQQQANSNNNNDDDEVIMKETRAKIAVLQKEISALEQQEDDLEQKVSEKTDSLNTKANSRFDEAAALQRKAGKLTSKYLKLARTKPTTYLNYPAIEHDLKEWWKGMFG